MMPEELRRGPGHLVEKAVDHENVIGSPHADVRSLNGGGEEDD